MGLADVGALLEAVADRGCWRVGKLEEGAEVAGKGGEPPIKSGIADMEGWERGGAENAEKFANPFEGDVLEFLGGEKPPRRLFEVACAGIGCEKLAKLENPDAAGTEF